MTRINDKAKIKAPYMPKRNLSALIMIGEIEGAELRIIIEKGN